MTRLTSRKCYDGTTLRGVVRAMSHEAIHRQPVPGNLKEENPFTFENSHNFMGFLRHSVGKILMWYQSGLTALHCSWLPPRLRSKHKFKGFNDCDNERVHHVIPYDRISCGYFDRCGYPRYESNGPLIP